MKRSVYCVLAVGLIFASCLSNRSSDTVKLEERVLNDIAVFNDDEFAIYDFVVGFLIDKYSKRVPEAAMTELMDKYSMEEMIKNPELVTNAAVQIENPKIVVNDETTVSSLRREKTYDENMETISNVVAEWIGKDYTGLLLDFKQKNIFDYSLAEYIAGNDNVISYNSIKPDVDDADANNYWKEFYKAVPNACGLITFSRIGFMGNKGIIEVKFMYGFMSGFVDYIMLEKSDGNWKAVKSNRYIYY
jgi:hypothetical protein